MWDLVKGAEEDVIPKRGQSVCAFKELTVQRGSGERWTHSQKVQTVTVLGVEHKHLVGSNELVKTGRASSAETPQDTVF